MSYRHSNLFTSIEVSDITPDKSSSEKLLEVKVLAWQRDREDVDKKWSLFSWYGDVSFEGDGVEIVDITTTLEYTNKFFGKDLSEDKKSISGLGFTQDPFASHNPTKFIAGISTKLVGIVVIAMMKINKKASKFIKTKMNEAIVATLIT